MSKWKLQSLELYCMFDSMNKKKTKFYSYDKGLFKKGGFTNKPTKVEVLDNPLYIKAERPEWCKKKFPGRKERTPEFKCLCEGGNQCPFLAYSDVDKEDAQVIKTAFCVHSDKSWNDKKMKVDKKVTKKFIEHMLKFDEEK